MSVKFFGQFLLECGAITREMLLDAIRYQKEINKPLCALALEKGYLDKQQIEALDAEHLRSDKKFMEIAISSKILTFDQLEELYKAKSARWVFLGEALVDRRYLTLSQLNDLFEEYRRQLPVEEGKLEDLLEGMPEPDILTAMLQVTVDLFIHYTKQIVQVESVEKTAQKLEGVAYMFAQKVVGDRVFHYALALPEELTLAIASHMMGTDQTEINPTVLDAVSEFANVVVGNGCTRLCLKSFKVMPEPPRIMTQETVAKLHPTEVVSVNMKTTKGTFRVLFFFEEVNDTVEEKA